MQWSEASRVPHQLPTPATPPSELLRCALPDDLIRQPTYRPDRETPRPPFGNPKNKGRGPTAAPLANLLAEPVAQGNGQRRPNCLLQQPEPKTISGFRGITKPGVSPYLRRTHLSHVVQELGVRTTYFWKPRAVPNQPGLRLFRGSRVVRQGNRAVGPKVSAAAGGPRVGGPGRTFAP